VDDLEKITNFIYEHHVMTLATHYKGEVSACSLFYVYDEKKRIFVVASADDTTHIKHIQENPNIAANILLETKTVGKIQGLQLRGLMHELQDTSLMGLYFKAFPYALALQPKLWSIVVTYFKMTDNTLGFGKKLTWST